MRHQNLRTGRGDRLQARLWLPDQTAAGVVLVVHGLGDHAGRYESFAEFLTVRNWGVFAFDLPGHGLSPGGRGVADSFDGLLADIALAQNTIGDLLPTVTQVLLGHSMGGNLALNYVLRRQQLSPASMDLAGLVLCAPMLLPPTPPPRPHIFAAWLTGHLFPWVRVHRPVDASALTSDPEEAAIIDADPMLHSRITIYLATQLLSQGRWALDHARDLDVPTLVMWGKDDPLIDQSACEHLSIRVGAQATQVSWPRMRHDLFHDQGDQAVIKRVADWLSDVQSNSDTSG